MAKNGKYSDLSEEKTEPKLLAEKAKLAGPMPFSLLHEPPYSTACCAADGGLAAYSISHKRNIFLTKQSNSSRVTSDRNWYTTQGA